MHKTVSTLVNGNIKELAHQKQQKSQKVILPASHWLCVNVLLNLHKILRDGSLTDVIDRPEFYLNQIRGFDSVGVKFLASPQEREVAINTGLELAFSLWYSEYNTTKNKWPSRLLHRKKPLQNNKWAFAVWPKVTKFTQMVKPNSVKTAKRCININQPY